MSQDRYPLQEIRDKVDLVEIISRHVALKKRGRNFVGLCPFHNEKTPSFSVNPELQIFKCFGCGESGDVFTYVQKTEGLTFPETVESLAASAGIQIERTPQELTEHGLRDRIYRANNIACRFFMESLKSAPQVLEYAKSRGLSVSTIEKYKIGYAPDGWENLAGHLARERVSTQDAVQAGLVAEREKSSGVYDRFRNRLIFPIVDTQDRIVAFGGRAMSADDPAKYLNSPETPVFSKQNTLYGMNIARKTIAEEDRVMIVEGYLDVITVHEAGFTWAVAPLGTALTERHAQRLSRFTKNVYLAFDSDTAGINATVRSAQIFEENGFSVRVINMPRGEDPDSILQKGDVSRFSELISRAYKSLDFRIKLAMSKFDMKDADGKAEALRAAAKVLATEDSVIERERVIRHLAKFHPNFSSGASRAEDDIRQEIAHARGQMAPKRMHEAYANPPAPANNAVTKKETVADIAEKRLLFLIISKEVDAKEVFKELPPGEFISTEGQILAQKLYEQTGSLGKIKLDVLRDDVSGTESESYLVDIMMGAGEEGLNENAEDLLRVILNHKLNLKRQRFQDLAKKIQEGKITRGDEEYKEYYELIKATANGWKR